MFCDYIHVLDICSVIKGQKKRMIKISWAFNVKPNKKNRVGDIPRRTDRFSLDILHEVTIVSRKIE